MTTPELPSTQLLETVDALWGVPLQPAGCEACKHIFLVPAARLGQACPDCARGKLAPQPAALRPEPPELILPFRVGGANLANIYANFTKGVWLACADFNSDSLTRRTTPLYWPMWLVDSDISGDWQAEMGYDYKVESSKEEYSSGSWRSRTQVETRIRWEPRLGTLARHYDNVSTPAVDHHQELMARLGGYHLEQVTAYQPNLVGSACMHAPDLQPNGAWPLAQSSLNKASAEECRQAANAQHVRNYAAHAQYNRLNWTQQLLPMYASYYSDDQGQPHLVYINGQTGSISGARIASQRKGWQVAGISAGIAVGIFILGLLCIALGMLLPPLVVLGAMLFAAAAGVGVFAIVPAVWPWQWNRGQQEVKITTRGKDEG